MTDKEITMYHKVAEERGWAFRWDYEEEDWSMFAGDIPDEPGTEYLWCALYDKDGQMLASLGGVGFAPARSVRNDAYSREVEAELVCEVLWEEEKKAKDIQRARMSGYRL